MMTGLGTFTELAASVRFEVEGNLKMVKACATMIAPDMVVNTRTERVLESRKTNL